MRLGHEIALLLVIKLALIAALWWAFFRDPAPVAGAAPPWLQASHAPQGDSAHDQ